MGSRRCVRALGAVGAASVLSLACTPGTGSDLARSSGARESGTTSPPLSDASPEGEPEASAAAAPPTEQRITLRGEEEVPGPGHPDATGTAVVALVEERNEVCVEVDVEGLDRPTAVHLHESPAGAAGEVVLALPSPTDGDDRIEACVIAPDGLLDRIAEDPAQFYVNVHSEAHVDGALRGQLG